jgi:UDP-glucose 4-epimerase
MNYLITGAAGFLGSALANKLASEGHQVRGIDDLSTGDPQALSKDVHFTRGDVNDRPKLWTLLQDVDCVYHLAARVSVPESILYPREYNAVNVGGTVSLMEAMRDVPFTATRRYNLSPRGRHPARVRLMLCRN